MGNGFWRKPTTQTGWRTLWLGLLTIALPFALGIIGTIYRKIFDPVSLTHRSSPPGMASAIFSIFIAPIAIISGVKALRSGERSGMMWLGFTIACWVALFWIVMIAGEFLYPH